MVMTRTHAKRQDQRSLGSKVRVKTDGRSSRANVESVFVRRVVCLQQRNADVN